MRAQLFTLKTILFFGLATFLTCQVSQAQTPVNTVLIVSPHVGEVIDLEEKERFNLFPYFATADYMIGRFLQLPDDFIGLEVVKKNGQIETRVFTQAEFELTGQLIDAKAATLPPAKPTQTKPPVNLPKHIAKSLSQELTGTIYYVILNDGTKFFATIAERRPNEYVFNTQYYGTVTANFQGIKYLKLVENKLHRNEFWIPNPHDSRLFFGPTGRGIPQGEGYFQTVYGYLNSFNYGVTSNFSIGTTFVIVPFIAIENSIFSITPKISLPVSKNTSLAAGVLYASFLGEQFGIVYGAGSIGNKNDNFTAGLGFGFFNEQLSNKPVVMFGGVKRISNRLALMSENYIIPRTSTNSGFEESETLAGGLYGLRFIWPRTNLDLAGFYVYDSEIVSESDNGLYTSYIFPVYVSFTFKIGNRKQIGKF